MTTTDPVDAALGRYLTGRSLRAQGGAYPFLGVRVLAARWAAPILAAAAVAGWVTHPAAARMVGLVALVAAVVWLRRRWRRGRFDRVYTHPSVKAIRVVTGTTDVQLRIDRGLGRLVARLARPMSPLETHVRDWYGTRIEPVLRWPVDRALTIGDRLYAPLRPHLARARVAVTPPREHHGPRIRLVVAAPFLTAEQRSAVGAIVKAKVPVGDVTEAWCQVGHEVTATWTPRRRPPAAVGLAELLEHAARLAEDEFFLGLGAGNVPVVVSLAEDSPHIALSAGSGAGKSVFARLVAAQVLHRGGSVVLLDRKGSHRALLDLPGVEYCTTAEAMHHALIRVAAVADRRNAEALHQPDGWDPGPRILVIAEELNATIGLLAGWWADNRPKGAPKRSPAIAALADLSFMGRSANANLLAIAQMLTARALGGPECRENFAVRCLARYTTNAAKMLVPEAAMPRSSRTLGRWQVVVGGTATETQVCFLTAAQVRAYAGVADVAGGPDRPLSGDVVDDTGVDCDITLREAVEERVVPWSLRATAKRLERGVNDPPAPVGLRGKAHTYRRADLAEWAGR